MTAGLEDAVALAHHLGEPGRSIPECLIAYQEERLPVVHRYQSSSRAVSHRTGRRRAPQVLKAPPQLSSPKTEDVA
jgi:2-polyprenyl-6-methoxyphenol hydroxylase-like FAD-dependent oxidoreductase